MPLPVVGIALFAVSLAPTVYYGITQGEWLYGWDYALTGHDYVGEFVDKILPSDDPNAVHEGSGMTQAEWDTLASQFANLNDTMTLLIVVVVAVAFLILMRGRR